MDVFHYVSPTGQDPFQVWLDGLRDLRCKVAVLRRVDRLAEGNSGDHKYCREGVWELRVDCGPGYRVYFARHAPDAVLLLGGGAKGTQAADIVTAVGRWEQYTEHQ